MRRTEVAQTLMESIADHFPADVAEKFKDPAALHLVAKVLQEMELDNYGGIDRFVRELVAETSDKTMDDLADGEIADPLKWLYDETNH